MSTELDELKKARLASLIEVLTEHKLLDRGLAALGMWLDTIDDGGGNVLILKAPAEGRVVDVGYQTGNVSKT
jgi:hypothetical protein